MASKSHHMSSNKCNHRYQMKTQNQSPEFSQKKVFYSPSTKFHTKNSPKCRSKAKSPCKCKYNSKIKEKSSAKRHFENFYSNRDFPSHYLDYAPESSCVSCQDLPLVLNHNLPTSQYYNSWKPAQMDFGSHPVNKKEPLKTAQTQRYHTYISNEYSQYRDNNNYMHNDNQQRQFFNANKAQAIQNKPHYSLSFGEHKFAQNHDQMLRINENNKKNQINPLAPIQSDIIQEMQREENQITHKEIEQKSPEIVIKKPQYEQPKERVQNKTQKNKKKQPIQIDIDNKKTMSEQIFDQLFAQQSQDQQLESSRQFNEHIINNNNINSLSFESRQNKKKIELKKQVEVNLVVNQNDPQIERERLIQKEKQIQRLREIQNYRQRELEYYKEKETQRQIQKQRQKQKQIQIQVQKQKYKEMQMNILREREKDRERERQRQRQRERQREREREREIQIERMRQAQKLRQIQIERERQRQINLRNSLSQTNDQSRNNQIIQTQKQRDTKKNESRIILQKWINNITDDRQFRKRIQQKYKQFNEIEVQFQDSSPVNLDSLMNSKDAYIKESQNFLNKLNQIITHKSTSSIKQNSSLRSINQPALSPSPLRPNSFIKNQTSPGTFQQVLPFPPNISNFQVPFNNQQLIPSQMIPHINPNTYIVSNPINGKINQMNRTGIIPAPTNKNFGQSESVLQFNQTHPQPQQVYEQVRYQRIERK